MIVISGNDEGQAVSLGQELARHGLDVTVTGGETTAEEIYDLIFGADTLVVFYAPDAVATQVGIALALGKLVYVIGDGENDFLDMDGIQVLADVDLARTAILDDHAYDLPDTDTPDTGTEDSSAEGEDE